VRKKALVPGAQTAGSWGWTYEGEDGPHATIRYEADLRDAPTAVKGTKIARPLPRRWITPAGPVTCSPPVGPANDIPAYSVLARPAR
jgi:hypothetical protein